MELREVILVLILSIHTRVYGACSSGFPALETVVNTSAAGGVPPVVINNISVWLFPSMNFSCRGNITKWMFQAVTSGDGGTSLPQMQVWREDRFASVLAYQLHSTCGTEDELSEVVESVHEYVLKSAVQVEEGDIFGLALEEPSLTLQFQDLGDTAHVSYWTEHTDSYFVIGDGQFTANSQYLPLVTAVMEECAVEEASPTITSLTPSSALQSSTSSYSVSMASVQTPHGHPTVSPWPPSDPQECVKGLMSAERVWQLGRVAGERMDDGNKQQRIIPDISFTCSGTVTRWIVAGDWEEDTNLPEVQIWRETATGSGIYTKIHGTVLPLSSRLSSEIYTFEAGSLDVQPGDILGLFEPSDTWLQLYYTETYGPVNYYIDTDSAVVAPSGDFDTSGDGVDSANDMPLVSVEINPSDGSLPAECIRNFPTMDAIVAGVEQTVDYERMEQRLIPGITFTCHGFITKWIIAARWDEEDVFPVLQTWRNLTDEVTYTRQGATTFNLTGGSREMTYYEYSPDPPHEFNDGDVLGMFLSGDPRYRLFFEEVDGGPLNYINVTGRYINVPPDGDFSVTDTGLDEPENAVPLIAVEVYIPPDSDMEFEMSTSTTSIQTPHPTVSSEATSSTVFVIGGVAAAVLVGVTISTVGVVLLVVRKKRTCRKPKLATWQMKENLSYGSKPKCIPVSGISDSGSIKLDVNPAYGQAPSSTQSASCFLSNGKDTCEYEYIDQEHCSESLWSAKPATEGSTKAPPRTLEEEDGYSYPEYPGLLQKGLRPSQFSLEQKVTAEPANEATTVPLPSTLERNGYSDPVYRGPGQENLRPSRLTTATEGSTTAPPSTLEEGGYSDPVYHGPGQSKPSLTAMGGGKEGAKTSQPTPVDAGYSNPVYYGHGQAETVEFHLKKGWRF